ncbi:MAG: efflux transporter outer membrane subunit [Gemmataceae bacterium]|nr:efflux transporter outer membrane subunit [Gemmataceae bacterium]
MAKRASPAGGARCVGRARRGQPPLLRVPFLLALLLSVGGCTSLREYIHNGFKVGPDYKRPPASAGEHWIDAADVRVRSEPVDDSHWWTLFGDPILNSLVNAAYQQNLTLREAGFRVLASRAQLGYECGNLFPQTQQAYADYTRKAISGTVANHQFTPERYYDVYDFGFNLAWEIDFWGRLRRAVAASADELDAKVENYDDVLVTLVADVAQSYLQIRTFQAELRYVRENLALQTKTLDLTKIRFANGAVSELDVSQATLNLARTEALIPPLELSLRRASNQLCILLGIPPESLAEKLAFAPIPTAPGELAVGIPRDLLRRRPDVRRAERELAAQGERIGIAVANLYPTLSINGSIGYQTTPLAQLVRPESQYGTIGPSLQWDILNYGRNLNRIRYEDARFEELVVKYQNSVLNANREAENGLAAFLQAKSEVDARERAVRAAQRSSDLVLIQYREGKIDFNRVFVIQRQLEQEQDQLAISLGNAVQSVVQVYRALGGGWQLRCGREPPPLATSGEAPPDELPAPRPVEEKRVKE